MIDCIGQIVRMYFAGNKTAAEGRKTETARFLAHKADDFEGRAHGDLIFADGAHCFEGADQTLADPDAVVAIARTAPVPGDPVVVRPGLGVDTVKALRSALIDLSTVPEARSFFTFAEIDGFVPAVDGDYDAVAKTIRAGGG